MATKSIVYVGCRLPHGIILDHPLDASKKCTLQGLNKSTIIGATYKTNEVDAEFWDAWAAVNKEFKPLKSGAIFVAKSDADLKDIGKDLVKEKTGFEPMQPKSHGVEPADKRA